MTNYELKMPANYAAIDAEEMTYLVGGETTGWQMFRKVTLPNIKWALLYGVILCNARAMGELGAV